LFAAYVGGVAMPNQQRGMFSRADRSGYWTMVSIDTSTSIRILNVEDHPVFAAHRETKS
jgi:hypothetical protein